MKVLVSGGRTYSNYRVVKHTLDNIDKQSLITNLIHGGAKGADSLGDRWAKENNVDIKVYKPDWNKYGKAAGVLRNQEMLDIEHPDIVVSFPGGNGTMDMRRRANQMGIKLLIVNDDIDIKVEVNKTGG